MWEAQQRGEHFPNFPVKFQCSLATLLPPETILLLDKQASAVPGEEKEVQRLLWGAQAWLPAPWGPGPAGAVIDAVAVLPFSQQAAEGCLTPSRRAETSLSWQLTSRLYFTAPHR